MMNIGIDFDNTLIDYHQLFAIAANDLGWIESRDLAREKVKIKLLNEDGNDIRWQQLQTAVYSEYIIQAKPYQGAKEFCEKVISSGNNLFIISHKTRVSNFDNKTDLIEPAKQWLFEHGFIGRQGIMQCENVFFLEALERKIQKIQEENIDIFVDDLDVVLTDQLFPDQTLGILFSKKNDHTLLTASSWYEISAFYDLCICTEMEVACSLAINHKKLPRKLFRISSGGNSCVYKVDWEEQSLIVKQSSNKVGLKNEYDALNLIGRKLNNVPRPILFDEKSCVLIETALTGNVITEIGDKEINRAVDFLVELDLLSRKKIQYRKASQHRDSLLSYIEKVEERLEEIRKNIGGLAVEESVRVEIAELLNNKFGLLWGKIKYVFFRKVENMALLLSEKFADDELILSPSDYGFHNMLITENGSLQVCDFEYFGWDDKAKLIADFFHHQGHELTDKHKLLFIKGICQKKIISGRGLHRLELILDVIGMEWVLIVLNVINKDKLQQRMEAGCNSGLSSAEIIKRQVLKADSILDKYVMRSENNNFFITSDICADEWAVCYV